MQVHGFESAQLPLTAADAGAQNGRDSAGLSSIISHGTGSVAGSAAIVFSEDGDPVAFDAMNGHPGDLAASQYSDMLEYSTNGRCIWFEYLGAVRRFILYVRVEDTVRIVKGLVGRFELFGFTQLGSFICAEDIIEIAIITDRLDVGFVHEALKHADRTFCARMSVR